MKTSLNQAVSLVAAFILAAPFARAADFAPDFKLTNRSTGAAIRRDDFAGKILMLDFFAWWCPPCVASSPIVEQEIAGYYRTAGGNAHGVKVEVLAVNVDWGDSAATDRLIAKAGLKNVADDPMTYGGAWVALGQGGIPHFVIIDGTGSHPRWEILHSAAGFRGAEFYRNLIDSIEADEAPVIPVIPDAPEIDIQQPAGSNLSSGDAKKSFGTVPVKSKSAAKTFVIQNTGRKPLLKISVSKSGVNPGDFVVTNPGKSTLKPGEKTQFTVAFNPKAKGSSDATLKVSSNDADESRFEIRLTGLAVAK